MLVMVTGGLTGTNYEVVFQNNLTCRDEFIRQFNLTLILKANKFVSTVASGMAELIRSGSHNKIIAVQTTDFV